MVTGSEVTTLSEDRIKRIRRAVMRWGRRNYKPFPWREPAELWQAVIAEVLLQRTRADNVVPVYSAFIARYPSAHALSSATEDDVASLVRPLGLQWRVPLLTRLSRVLGNSDGRVPRTYNELVALPGVGPYVAAAVLSLHCGQRHAIVDANIVRWLCRIVGTAMDRETRRKKWLLALADDLTPKRNWRAYNYAALDFTMAICSRSPRCEDCPVRHPDCAYAASREVAGQQ